MTARYGAEITAIDLARAVGLFPVRQPANRYGGERDEAAPRVNRAPTPPLVNRSAGVVTPMMPRASLYPGSRYGEVKPQSIRALTTAKPPLPSILSFGIAYGLPLHVGNRIGSATGEPLNVVLAVARASSAGSAIHTPNWHVTTVEGAIRVPRPRGPQRNSAPQRRSNWCAKVADGRASRPLAGPLGLLALGSLRPELVSSHPTLAAAGRRSRLLLSEHSRLCQLASGSITASAVNTTRHQRRAALRAATKRGTASNTCLTCGLKFLSRDLYLEHVVRDHGIPPGHRIFDFEGTVYDVTSIERLAATSGNYGPFDVDLTPQIMWSISGVSLDEARLRSLTPAELARPVLIVRHASHDRNFRSQAGAFFRCQIAARCTVSADCVA
jgi:hypothetical protein